MAERPIYLGVVMIVTVLESSILPHPNDQAVTVFRLVFVSKRAAPRLVIPYRSWAYVG